MMMMISKRQVIVVVDIYDDVVSHIQRIGCQPEKTALPGGQYRSWSAEQGKKENIKSLVGQPPTPPPPPPARAARSEKVI